MDQTATLPTTPTAAARPFKLLVVLGAVIALAATGCATEGEGGDPAGETAAQQSSEQAARAELQGVAEANTGCVADETCPTASPHCDLSVLGGRCVACRTSFDCPLGDAKPLCLNNSCVAATPCKSDKACAAMGGVCDKAAGVCAECTSESDCAADQACQLGQCVAQLVPCASSKACAAFGLVCDAAVGVCVDCAEDQDCAEGAWCLVSACVADVCAPGTATCDTSTSIRTCRSNGSGYDTTSCPANLTCEAGACTKPVGTAAPSKPANTDKQPKTSKPTVPTCSVAIETCAGTKPKVCEPNAEFCAGVEVCKCNAKGTASALLVTCGSKTTCKGGVCVTNKATPPAKEEPKPDPVVPPTAGKVAKADIIWFVDTSGSMAEESKSVSDNLDKFAAVLEAKSVDFRIVLVGKSSGCCALSPKTGGALNSQTFKHVTKAIYSTDGLKKLVDNQYFNNFKSFLRPGVAKHIVGVTDDDSLQMTAANFEKSLMLFKPDGIANAEPLFKGYTFHSIVAWGPVPHKGCATAARIGAQYLALTQKTGGVKGLICAADLMPSYNGIANVVVTKATKP